MGVLQRYRSVCMCICIKGRAGPDTRSPTLGMDLKVGSFIDELGFFAWTYLNGRMTYDWTNAIMTCKNRGFFACFKEDAE